MATVQAREKERDAQIRESFAPEGSLNPDVQFGGWVRATAVLKDVRGAYVAGWTRETLDEPRVGLVVGVRFPYSGKYKPQWGGPFPDDYDPGHRTADIVHRCYLVAFDERSNPVYVLADDVEPVAYPELGETEGE